MCDNIIECLFERIFIQYVSDRILYKEPWLKIRKMTIENQHIHDIISKLCVKSVEMIKIYLEEDFFQKRLLKENLKNDNYVAILLKTNPKFDDETSKELAIINGYDLKLIFNKKDVKPSNKMMELVIKFNLEYYFYLVEFYNLVPNILLYNSAIEIGNLEIVKYIGETIGLNKKLIQVAMKSGHVPIITYIIDEISIRKFPFDAELISYPIMYNDLETLYLLEEKLSIKYDQKLVYSAILSGSLKMFNYVCDKLDSDLHNKKVLDLGENSGQKSLILNEIIYHSNNKKYFSHCMNYAIQSNSLEMVKHIWNLGYGISASNFITAIMQADPEILEFISSKRITPLPQYLLHYFSFNVYVDKKITKAKILLENNLISLNFKDNFKLDDYKKANTHGRILETTCHYITENIDDIDFYTNIKNIFNPGPGYKLDILLSTKFRLGLDLSLDTCILDIIESTIKPHDKQLLIDILFIFGTITQIKKYHPMIDIKLSPSKKIIKELMCRLSLAKIAYLIHYKLIIKDSEILALNNLLDDVNLKSFISKILII